MDSLDLPADLAAALRPLFEEVPLERAMDRLVATEPRSTHAVLRVEEVLKHPALKDRRPLAAGLWLYVDELNRSHKLSQQDEADPTLSFWHGVMHRREGDFSNSHYWFRRVGDHEAMRSIAGYDPHRFIDDVERANRAGESPTDLVDLQRREWAALFAWCAARGK